MRSKGMKKTAERLVIFNGEKLFLFTIQQVLGRKVP
jgi:hypothetical protein